jgi:hypothetical protein
MAGLALDGCGSHAGSALGQPPPDNASDEPNCPPEKAASGMGALPGRESVVMSICRGVIPSAGEWAPAGRSI